jgi:hypothetical protein
LVYSIKRRCELIKATQQLHILSVTSSMGVDELQSCDDDDVSAAYRVSLATSPKLRKNEVIGSKTKGGRKTFSARTCNRYLLVGFFERKIKYLRGETVP